MKLNFDNINKLTINKKLLLDCGIQLDKFDIAFETYGKLDQKRQMPY